MEPFGRQPPRFVPTLTDVVPEGLPLQKPAQLQEPVWGDALHADTLAADADTPEKAPLATASVNTADTTDATAAVDAPAADTFPAEPELSDSRWEADLAEGDAHLPAVELSFDGVDAPAPGWDAMALHAALVQRILDRVQPQLEAHLREVVADVVSEHVQAMARSLHGAVEEVVQQAVADAIEQEQIQEKMGLNAYF